MYILKGLSPVCIKCRKQGKSQVANIAHREATILFMRLSPSAVDRYHTYK